MEMVNGYVFLDLTKTNVYSKALKVLGTDKPVVIKDGSGSPYFVDSMALDGTNVVITKGGKTIAIANDNTITNVGDIQNHLYEHNINIADNIFNDINITLLNDNNDVFTYDILVTTLIANKTYQASGCSTLYGDGGALVSGLYSDGEDLFVKGMDIDSKSYMDEGFDKSTFTIVDTIKQLF